MKGSIVNLRSRLRALSLTAAGALVLLGLTACSTVVRAPTPALASNARWAVLPIANDTETPLAGNRAAAIVEAVLRARGVGQLERAPLMPTVDALFDPSASVPLAQSLAWARTAGVRYALTGTVTEWRYKVGVDGEPAVGLTLQLIDVGSDQVLWSASGSRSGWSRQSLSGTAQQLIEELARPLAAAGS